MTEILIELFKDVLPKRCQVETCLFTDVDLIKALVSKALGFSLIAASVLVKMPQIAKILTNKSAAGLSIYAVLFEMVALTFYLSYSYVSGFPFSAYGDVVFLGLQTVFIACLILHYSGSTAKAVALSVVYAIFCFVLMGGITPLETLWTLQAFTIPVMLAGKSVQVYTNYRNGSTGQLSAVTCFMLFFGSLARIFTSYQETGDSMIILTFFISTLANAVIVTQLLWYWNAGATKKGKKAGKEATKKQTKTKSKKAN